MRKMYFATLLITVSTAGFAQLKNLQPGFNLFSAQQDIQVGQEAAAQVQQQQPVVNNAQLNGYLSDLLQRLAKTPHGQSEFPYQVHAIASKEVNAFALPGGPIFVYTGLIQETNNEAELAGVLAHEMTHVKLRHGTHQASQANLIELPLALAGRAVGTGSLLAQLTQLGIGLGANSVLLKMSRSAESQADYNGAQTMAEAGYNPVSMAQFFQRLEASGGKEGRLAQFLSDHPSPGNRVGAVQGEIRQMQPRTYTANTGQFPAIKQLVAGIPVPPASKPVSQR
jgi:predicted Zn-dependent protease